MKRTSPLTPLPVTDGNSHDIVVAGCGVSGAVAAVAAARQGARTLVIERHGFPGGALTAMGVGPMMSFHNRAGRQLVAGIPQEIVDRLKEAGGSPGHIPDSITYCSTVTPFDAETLKTVLDSMLAESGAEVLFHASLVHAETEDGRVSSVIAATKRGLVRFPADVFVDATGDADLAFLAGVPCVKGKEDGGAAQPMTMNLKVGNVDTARIREYAASSPDDFHFTHGAEEGLARLETTPRVSLAGYLREWKEAVAAGEVHIPREYVLFFETAEPGVVNLNTSRIQGLDATDPEDVSRAEAVGREQCRELFAFLKKRCPGFERAVNLGTSAHIGVRESRRISGRYTLTAEDLVSARRFPDPVALGGYPIDIHSPDRAETNTVHLPPDSAYMIPLGCLLADEAANLVTVGRAVSATHEASAAIRVSPIAMAVGQAGGTLAGQAVVEGAAPGDVPYGRLGDALLKGGVILE